MKILALCLMVAVASALGTRAYLYQPPPPATPEACKNSPECRAAVEAYAEFRFQLGMLSGKNIITKYCQQMGWFSHETKRYSCVPMKRL